MLLLTPTNAVISRLWSFFSSLMLQKAKQLEADFLEVRSPAAGRGVGEATPPRRAVATPGKTFRIGASY